MASYSKEFKEKMIARMLPPNNEPVSKISKETKISIATLHKWKKNYTSTGNKLVKSSTADKWSSQDKFLVVMETASMNEIELSCRSSNYLNLKSSDCLNLFFEQNQN